MKDPVLAQAAALDAERRPYVLATVVWRRRPTSGKPGAKAIVLPDGTMRGWLGGACAGPAVTRQALRALRKGAPRLLCLGTDEEFPPAGSGRVVEPIHCASEGAMEVFLEPRIPAPRVITIGEAPASARLARLAEALDFEVKRLRLAEEGSRFENMSPDDEDATIDPASWILVATMGEYDEEALSAALATTAPYVALVASKKRAPAVFENLRRRGLSDDDLARVRSPAGLDLGPITHEEIAVAVLAEIVQLKASSTLEAPSVAVQQPVEARDPVCGMTVRTESRHRAEHDGETYYFCCGGCRERFVAEPSSFL